MRGPAPACSIKETPWKWCCSSCVACWPQRSWPVPLSRRKKRTLFIMVADASAVSIRSRGLLGMRRLRWRTSSLQMPRSPRKQRTEVQPPGAKNLKAAA
ncbi:FXYD domain-containing ion transport regulator 6 isoform X3 [Ovis aries]|uniref:Uncharacterized protein n=1 Tax=Ovis ammon polii x Ovis aries TaxID=2918886 RepID=A0ACB9UTE5_9CETA|nr:FXYD domain-containing ion transport regulator 6 isoform X3 [Ovis aries]KAI4580784.1 hypothetical protein MJG53_010326 [Ovis ammon polii x Ovis aries]